MARELIVFLLLCACGDVPDEAWRSELGIRMVPGELENYFTPEQVDTHALHMRTGLAELGLPLDALKEGAGYEWVWMRPTAFRCPTKANPQRLCMGTQNANTLWIAATPCVWQTALAHEMAHHLLEYVRGDPDRNHTWAEVWALASSPLGDCPSEKRGTPWPGYYD